MNSRERFQAIMNFRPFDRLPVIEWAGWWNATLERWYKEGLPLYITDRYEICEFFGLDIYWQDWISVQKAGCPEPVSHGSGIIQNESDYRQVKSFLYPSDSVQVDSWECWAARQQRGDAVLWFSVDGFFWLPRFLLGIERHLYAFYDQPDLIHKINADLADWILEMVDNITAICTPDFMTFAEDLSYNHGPMLSGELFNEFIRPYYGRVVPRLRELGIIPIVDSDGDMTEPACWFENAGIDGILPLERQSGVDIVDLRRRHPELKFIGHFNKMVMSKGEPEVRREFERLLPAAKKGGFLPACDHQVPPGVSYDNYRIYLELFREYAWKAGEMSQEF